jgi:MFS family permease
LTFGRRAGFAAVAYAFCVAMLSSTLPTPLYPLYEQRWGFSALLVTIIFATYAAGVVVALVLFGRLSDQVGRRAVLLPALWLAAASAVCFVVAQGLVPILAGRALSGLSVGIFTGAGTAALVDLAPEGHRDLASKVAVAVNLGGLGVGTLLSGGLAQTGVVPVRLPFWVDLALLVPAVAGVALAPETVRRRGPLRLRAQRLGVPANVRGTFVRASIAAFAAFAISGLYSAVAPTFLARILGYSSHVLAGAIVCVVFAASAAGQLALGRIPSRLALPAGCAGLIAGAGLVAAALAARSLALLTVGALVVGVAQGVCVGAGLVALNAETPADRRGEVASAFFVIAYVGLCIPIVGVGIAVEGFGLRPAGMAFSAFVGALAAVALVSLLRRSRRPPPRAAAERA